MDLFLYSPIGPDSTLQAIEAISSKEDITVHLNSVGGSVYDGMSIFNLLSTIPNKVHVSIEGMAASVASVIAMAGDTVDIHETGMVMIHNSRAMLGGGTKDQLQQQIDLMGKIDKQMVNIYARKTGKGKRDIQAAMDKETYFTASEALEFGLVNTVIKPQRIAAELNIDKMENVLNDIKSKFNSLIGSNLKEDEKKAAQTIVDAAEVLAEKKLETKIQDAPTSADKITAEMVKTIEFEAKMILLDDYIKSSYEHTLKAQVFIDKFDAAVKAEVKLQMDELLAQIVSKTEVPAAKTTFTEFEAEQSKKERDEAMIQAGAEREKTRELKA